MKDFSIYIPSDAQKIMSVIADFGFEVYLVGGCVRDSVMGRVPKDWDITTNATPQQIQDMFEHTIPTGIKHGTITVMMHGEGYEVTTFRQDGLYSDGRSPDSVKFVSSLKEDLSRRDFTMNAMAYNEEVGIVDYFGGMDDINNRIVRCVGSAKDRFSEDALRMLRALRFSAQLNFKLDNDIRYSMECLYKNIGNVSVERVQAELNKILLSNNPEIIGSIEGCMMFESYLSEIYKFNTNQNSKYHLYSSTTHSLVATSVIERKLHLRLSAMLHDVGKANTKITDDEGVDHFPNHAKESVKIAEEILKRLKYDNKTIKKVLTLIENHDKVIVTDKQSVKRFLRDIGFDNFNDWCSLRMADLLAQNPKYIRRRIEKLYKIKELAREVQFYGEPYTIKDLDIDGNDLMKIGLKGKEIKIVLDKLLDVVIESCNMNHKDYLIMMAEIIFKEGL